MSQKEEVLSIAGQGRAVFRRKSETLQLKNM